MLDTAGDSTHVVIAAACILYSLSCVRCYYGTLFCLSPLVGQQKDRPGGPGPGRGPGGRRETGARGGRDSKGGPGKHMGEREGGGEAGGGGGARSSTVGQSRCMMAVRTGS